MYWKHTSPSANKYFISIEIFLDHRRFVIKDRRRRVVWIVWGVHLSPDCCSLEDIKSKWGWLFLLMLSSDARTWSSQQLQPGKYIEVFWQSEDRNIQSPLCSIFLHFVSDAVGNTQDTRSTHIKQSFTQVKSGQSRGSFNLGLEKGRFAKIVFGMQGRRKKILKN